LACSASGAFFLGFDEVAGAADGDEVGGLVVAAFGDAAEVVDFGGVDGAAG
jgi:hypothetical protein